MTPDYPAVLTVLYPGAQWTLNGDTYAGLTWLDEGDAPSQAVLDAAWPAVQVEQANAAAKAARAAAFREEADPLYFASQRGEGTKADWIKAVQEIRARYPYVEAEG